METLQGLRKELSILNKDRDVLLDKITKLEQQEINNIFKVGECYLNTCCGSFKKIIAINKEKLHCIVVNEDVISRYYYNLINTKCWKKITSKQFKDVYLAVMKDIQDPDLEDKKQSNWDVILDSITQSIDNK